MLGATDALLHLAQQSGRRRTSRHTNPYNIPLPTLINLLSIRMMNNTKLHRRRSTKVRDAVVVDSVPNDIIVDFTDHVVRRKGGIDGPDVGPAAGVEGR